MREKRSSEFELRFDEKVYSENGLNPRRFVRFYELALCCQGGMVGTERV
jgi:hypothetical protein